MRSPVLLATVAVLLFSAAPAAAALPVVYNGILVSGNPNGLTGFRSGNGAIVLDVGPWMTAAYTSNPGIPNLVDSLSSLLMGGQLSYSVRAYIVNYVANTTNFPYTTPTTTQMRDRVRAVVHLLLISPDFTIQK